MGVPFYAEDTPVSWLARWSRATGVARLFAAGEEEASFDRRAEEAELLFGRGWRRGATIWRLSGSFLLRDRRFGPSRLEPGAPLEFDGPEENHRERLLGMEARWWRPSFEEWEGVDRLGGVEDIDLGWSARLIAGLSPRALGGTADEEYGKVRLDAGARPGPTTLAQMSLEVSTRLRSTPENLVARVRARWASRLSSHHTLAMGAYGAASQHPDRDFQEVLGGLNGMRGLGARGLAGQQAWRLNAEHRWRAAEDLLQLISLGTATFYDLGRTWGPGAVEERWRQDAGVGLRIALPRSGLDRVARLDIAWPIHPAPGDDPGPVISIGSGQAF